MKPVETIAWIVLADHPYPTTSPPREGGLPRIELIDRRHYDALLRDNAAGPIGPEQPGASMTKTVRIENADTGNWPVRVTVQHKNEAGEWVDQPGSTQIDRPTQMHETYLTSHRRLVIEERPADPPPSAQG